MSSICMFSSEQAVKDILDLETSEYYKVPSKPLRKYIPPKKANQSAVREKQSAELEKVKKQTNKLPTLNASCSITHNVIVH